MYHIAMIPPLHDDPTFAGMLEFSPGGPQSSAMDQSSAGGSAVTEPQTPLDSHFMDFWQYQQALLGQGDPSMASGVQQSSYILPSRQAHSKPVTYEEAAQMNPTYDNDTTFDHYPTMFQQTIPQGQAYGLPFTTNPVNAAGTTAVNGHEQYQPSNDSSHMGLAGSASGLQPSGTTRATSFNSAVTAHAPQPIAFGGPLNISALPQTSARAMPFREDTGLSGLAQAQDFITWFDHDDNNGTTVSSSVPKPMLSETTTASSSFAYGQFPEQSIWQNSPMPFAEAEGLPGHHNGNGNPQQFQQNSQQNQSALQLQVQASAPPITIQVPDNNAMNHDNSTNTMQVQPNNLMPSDECMQLYLWSREAYPDASESAFSMPNQPMSASNHEQRQTQPKTQTHSAGLPQQASLRGSGSGTTMFAVPAPKKSPMQQDNNHFIPERTQSHYNAPLPQAVPHHPSLIIRQKRAPPQPDTQAVDNSQFMAYAMPAPVNSANDAHEPLMGRSEAYHQHTAIAGKLEILALESNPSHSAGIL